LIRMKRGRVPRFGATQWTMTGWQTSMSPGSPARRGTPWQGRQRARTPASHHVAVALEALDVC
jgi:hypothetical protein